MSTIGQRVREARENHKPYLSQRALIARIRSRVPEGGKALSLSGLQKIERGETTRLHARVKIQLLEALPNLVI